MQNNKLTLAVLCAAGLTLAACGSGNTPSNSNTQHFNVTTLTPPAGFSPVGAAGSSNVAVNLTTGQVAWPIGTSYQIFTLPSDLLAALQALPNLNGVSVSTQISTSATYAFTLPNHSIYLLTPSTSSSSVSVVNNSTAKNSAKPQANTALLEAAFESTPLTIFTSNTYPLNAGTVLVGGIDESGVNAVSIQYTNGTGQAALYPATDCPAVASTEKITTVAIIEKLGVSQNTYLAIGTSAGSVCVFGNNGQQTQPQVQNLTPSALNHGYPATNTAVSPPFGFYAASNDNSIITGYWLVGGQIYRVNGNQNQTTGVITPQSFLSVTGSPISGNNGTTFTNSPTNVVAALTDTQGTEWVINSADNTVWALPSGLTAWSQAASNNAVVKATSLTATPTGVGVYANSNGSSTLVALQ